MTVPEADAELFAHRLAAGRVVDSTLLALLASGRCRRDAFCAHSLPWDDGAAAAAAAALAARSLSAAEDRAVGALLGMAVGDALGAPVEFMPVRHRGEPATLAGMAQLLPGQRAHNVFHLRAGQWTDDCSMGLCVADSLLACGFQLRPADLMLRFCAWWHGGYNNAFRHDEQRGDRSSVGLGGTIGAAMADFERNGEPLTRAGDGSSSGNGSIMRLGAVACCFAADEAAACAAARLQSRTTHAGDEAAECAALMAAVMTRGIRAAGGMPVRALLALDDFDTPCAAVACLARSQAEPGGDPDRDWNWKNPDFRFSPSRCAAQPGYVGSYAMDALAMALHCVWHTDSAEAALLLAANHRGDADSVAAVTGQLAGAVYGASTLPAEWLRAVQQWDDGGGVALRALHLYRRTLPAAMQAAA